MGERSTVLVITNPDDTVAERVSQAIRRSGIRVCRYDFAEFPLRSRVTAAWTEDLRTIIAREHDESVNFDEVRSVWYRRPVRFQPSAELSPFAKRFAVSEATDGFGGVLRLIDAYWMNHPAAVSEASFKLVQLREAKHLGLRTPETLLTNSSAEVVRFLDRHDRKVVIKPIGRVPAPSSDDLRGKASDLSGMIFTTRVGQLTEEQLGRVGETFVFLQEEIEKESDVRVTVVEGTCYAARIDSQASPVSVVDVRRGGSGLLHEPHELPEEIRAKLAELLTRLNLRFAAVDLVRDTHGDYVFLEVNPNGEYGWIERRLGFPISDSIADALVEAKR